MTTTYDLRWPRMTWSYVLYVIAVAATTAVAEDDVERGHHSHDEDSHADHYHGHSMLDFSSIGILLALKLKLILLGLAVAAIAILFKSSKPSYGYYPYIDYQYVGYEVPPGTYASAPYRRPMHGPIAHANIGPKSFYLSELTARVWNSIDVTGMALGAMGVPEGPCRRRVVCQAEKAADGNTVLRTALGWLGDSLSKYKASTRSENDGQVSCEELYADCPHHNLPTLLGGSGPRPMAPRPYPGQGSVAGHTGHFKQSPWIGQESPLVSAVSASSISKEASRLDPRKDIQETSLPNGNRITKAKAHHYP